jgi:dihydrodipicolinate synthase/N-acetylneuraminate lyase
MFNLSETLNATVTALDSNKTIEIEKLADLVEAQISNVLGGGYSQYSCCHLKNVQQ